MPDSKTTLNANVETARAAGSDPSVLVLVATDNVGTAIRDIAPGALLTLRGQRVVTTTAVPLGHKIALQPIPQGTKIMKYNAPIGSATRDIAAGEHVHTHNMKSDYLPSFGREGSGRLTHGGH
jgi:altronate dehydratase